MNLHIQKNSISEQTTRNYFLKNLVKLSCSDQNEEIHSQKLKLRSLK